MCIYTYKYLHYTPKITVPKGKDRLSNHDCSRATLNFRGIINTITSILEYWEWSKHQQIIKYNTVLLSWQAYFKHKCLESFHIYVKKRIEGSSTTRFHSITSSSPPPKKKVSRVSRRTTRSTKHPPRSSATGGLGIPDIGHHARCYDAISRQ